MGHFPAGASVQSIVHYAQIINSDAMPLFDWGSAKANQEHYGQDKPPNVDLSKITMPTAMFGGTEDDLGDPSDVNWAKGQMNSKALVHFEEVKAGHSTFMVAKDGSYMNTVLSLVEKYNPL